LASALLVEAVLFFNQVPYADNFTASTGVGYPLLCSIVPRIPDIDFIKVIYIFLNIELFPFNFHKYNNWQFKKSIRIHNLGNEFFSTHIFRAIMI
jgi:hypothetical protein